MALTKVRLNQVFARQHYTVLGQSLSEMLSLFRANCKGLSVSILNLCRLWNNDYQRHQGKTWHVDSLHVLKMMGSIIIFDDMYQIQWSSRKQKEQNL